MARSMRPCTPRPGSLALALLVSLASIVGLGLETEAPSVDLAGIRLLDDGQEICARGILVDLRRYDSGFESLVIASPDGQNALRVYVSQGLRPQPSEYARIGDSLRVLGRVSNSGHETVLYCIGDSVSVESRAEAVLTVRILSQTWPLLLGDEIRVRGLIASHLAIEGCRLYDPDFAHSIALTGAVDAAGAAPFEVVVVGTLGLENESMALRLEVVALLPPG